jgi:hypothetical protein
MLKFLFNFIKIHPNTPKSKTFWTAMGSLLFGLGQLVNCYIQGDWSNGPTAAAFILAGLGGITGRDAITKLSEKMQ